MLAVFRALTSGQFRPAARGWRDWRKLAYERELEDELSPALVPFPDDTTELAEAPAALLDDGRWVRERLAP